MAKPKEYMRKYRERKRGEYEETKQGDTSYFLQHRPGNPLEYPDEVATADKIMSSGIFPRDFLEHPEYYLTMSDAGARETVRILRDVQGRPDAEVTIYRGAPSPQLNTGDWVTLSRSYAEQYAGDGGYSDNPNSKVYTFKAKAGDLSFDGDDISEFGYWGRPLRKRA